MWDMYFRVINASFFFKKQQVLIIQTASAVKFYGKKIKLQKTFVL